MPSWCTTMHQKSITVIQLSYLKPQWAPNIMVIFQEIPYLNGISYTKLIMHHQTNNIAIELEPVTATDYIIYALYLRVAS